MLRFFLQLLICLLTLLVCPAMADEGDLLNKARRITGYSPHLNAQDNDTPHWDSLADENIKYSGSMRSEPGAWFRMKPDFPEKVASQEDMNRWVYAMAYALLEKEKLKVAPGISQATLREWLRKSNTSIYGLASLEFDGEQLWLHMAYSPEARILAAFRNDELRRSLNKREKKVLQTCAWWITENVSMGMPNAQKLHRVHDALIDTTVYTRKEHDPLSVLLEGKGSCVAYSRAFQLLLHMLRIDCRIVYGTTEMNHVWNLVELDEAWYHVDLTWDDPIASAPLRTYNYYLMTDVEANADHDWVNPELYEKTPPINSKHFHMRYHTRHACRAAASGYTLPREDEYLAPALYNMYLNNAGGRAEAVANLLGVDLNRNPDIEAFFKLEKKRLSLSESARKLAAKPFEKTKEAVNLMRRPPVRPQAMSETDKYTEIRDSDTFNQMLRDYAAVLAGTRLFFQCAGEMPAWRMRELVGLSDINKFAMCFNAIYDEKHRSITLDVRYWDHIRILHAAQNKEAAARLTAREQPLLTQCVKKAADLRRCSSDEERVFRSNSYCSKGLKCRPVAAPMEQHNIRSHNSLGRSQTAYVVLNLAGVPTELIFGRVKKREETWCISQVNGKDWLHTDYYAYCAGQHLQPCCFRKNDYYTLMSDAEIGETHTWDPESAPTSPASLEKETRERLKDGIPKDLFEQVNFL